MYYLVGESVYTFNSGIEFSQFQRLVSFNKHGYDTKLVTRNYDRFLARDAVTHHIDPKQIINMYDYFQGTVSVERNKQNLRDLDTIPLEDYHVVGMDNNHSHVLSDGKLIEDIDVMPGTISLINDNKYQDRVGNMTLQEFWDWRGFLSMTETYHPSGDISHQQYFNLQGVPVIEVAYMNLHNRVHPTMWKLINYKNKDYHFDSENQLFSFFLNEINTQQSGVFISDRRSVDDCVLSVKEADGRYAYVHNVPFQNPKHPTKSVLLPDYKAVFNLDDSDQQVFDKVIFPTEDLKQDIQARFPEHVRKFVSAPDSWYSISGQPRKLTIKKQLIYVGRLSEDKNIEDLIEVFKLLYDKRNDISLLLQGYFSSADYENKIHNLIKINDLKDFVTIKAYNPNVQDVYGLATLFVNTAKAEGFGMNMLESMSYGVPIATYSDIYSKKNLVRSGINGITTKNKSASVLANQIDELLCDEEQYKKLSKGAISTAREFSENKFINKWAAII